MHTGLAEYGRHPSRIRKRGRKQAERRSREHPPPCKAVFAFDGLSAIQKPDGRRRKNAKASPCPNNVRELPHQARQGASEEQATKFLPPRVCLLFDFSGLRFAALVIVFLPPCVTLHLQCNTWGLYHDRSNLYLPRR